MKEFSYINEIYRKIIHLSSIWIVFALYYIEKPALLALFSLCTVLVMAYEFLRRGDNRAAKLLKRFLGAALRADEEQGNFKPSGAVYVFISALLSTLLFSKIVAITAISVMIIGDAAAALVGAKFGRTKFKALGKSLEGSIAFFIFSLLPVLFISRYTQAEAGYIAPAICGIFAATLVELFSKKILIDDNLSIPLTVGGVMVLLS